MRTERLRVQICRFIFPSRQTRNHQNPRLAAKPHPCGTVLVPEALTWQVSLRAWQRRRRSTLTLRSLMCQLAETCPYTTPSQHPTELRLFLQRVSSGTAPVYTMKIPLSRPKLLCLLSVDLRTEARSVKGASVIMRKICLFCEQTFSKSRFVIAVDLVPASSTGGMQCLHTVPRKDKKIATVGLLCWNVSLILLIVTFRVDESTAATCGSSSTAGTLLLRPLQSLLLLLSSLSQLLAGFNLSHVCSSPVFHDYWLVCLARAAEAAGRKSGT